MLRTIDFSKVQSKIEGSSNYVFHLVATTPDQRVYSALCEPFLMIAGDEDAFMSAVQGS